MNLREAETLLLDSEADARKALGLPTQHAIAPEDMLFKYCPDLLENLVNKDNPIQTGLIHFARGQFDDAQRIWAPFANTKRGHVISTVNFDPAFHRSLTSWRGWPEVERLRDAPRGKVAWISCDGRYLELFGCALILSWQAHSDIPIHLHVMDPSEDHLVLAHTMATEGLSVEYPGAGREYYHAVRFIRFRDDLERYGQCLLLDADQLINNDPRQLFVGDVAMRTRPGRLEPWNQFNASAVYGNDSPESLEYFGKVAAYITNYANNLCWGIDQAALFAVWLFGCRPQSFHCYQPSELDYDYTPEGIVWPNSGNSKFKGDPDRPIYAAKADIYNAMAPTARGYALRGKKAFQEGRYGESLDAYMQSIDLAARKTKIKQPAFPAPPPGRKVGKFVYLPVEIKARELPAKAQLAGQLAKLGYQVLMGATWIMLENEFQDLPPGIVLFKTANAFDARNIYSAQLCGHICAVLNEEAFVQTAEADLYRAQCNPSALENVDAYFCQGERQAAEMRQLMQPAKMKVTGNPRAFMREKVSKLGDEILVCMMSGNLNNVIPFDEYIATGFKAFGSSEPDVVALIKDQIEHEIKWAPVLWDSIAVLRDRFPDRTVRVRAHPTEDMVLYKNLPDGVVLDDRTPFTERVKDAAVVVFMSGCGTGLEAQLAGVPAVRLGTGGHGISKDIGWWAADVEEVAKRVEWCLGGAGLYSGLPAEHFAPDTLAHEIDNLFQAHGGARISFNLERLWDLRAEDAKTKVGEFHRNKWPETTVAEVEAHAHHKAKQVGWNLWYLAPEGQNNG